MKKFAILADATCDLGPAFREQYDIHVLPGHVVLPDKREILSLPQWDWCSCDEFYRDLKRNPNAYTTSPANVAEFAAAMEELAVQGLDILVMTISGGISGAYNFALQAAALTQEKHPDTQIACVDSRRFGPGFGLMVIHASLCREKGMTLTETADWLETNKLCFRQAGWHDDLSFVAKKGRVTHAKAFFGTLAGVKPLGELDSNGLTTVIGKAKGTKAAFGAILHYVASTEKGLSDQIVLIAHSARKAQAEQYKALLEERFHPREIHICDIHACCGVNIGPGMMAAYYMGTPISEGLVEERKIVETYLKEGQ